MKALWPALALLLLIGGHSVEAVGGSDGGAQGSERAAFVVPPALQGLLDAADDAGTPILGDKERRAFDAMSDHAKKLTAEAVAEEMITTAVHLKTILSLGMANGKFELFMQDNCVLCHS
ncbi:MAG: hypothetical protein ACE5D3_08850, partial [Candidatus Binatia bacterium]